MTTLLLMESRKDLRRFLKAAVRSCQAAGRLQMKSFGKTQKEEHKGEIDLVTAVDRQSEELIAGILRRAFPGHGLVAEEGSTANGGSEYLWVVDPLDGTTNFSRGFPFFCVSVALTVGGRPVVGAVYIPVLDELFTAIRGGGAKLNGRTVAVTARTRLGESFLATGFPYDIRRSRRNNLDHFSRLAVRSLAIRRAGAAAIDLAYVAAGRFDGFWELKLKPWDMAAGALLVEEAGGKISTPRGGRWSLGRADIVATNGFIHDELLAVLNGRRFRPPAAAEQRKEKSKCTSESS